MAWEKIQTRESQHYGLDLEGGMCLLRSMEDPDLSETQDGCLGTIAPSPNSLAPWSEAPGLGRHELIQGKPLVSSGYKLTVRGRGMGLADLGVRGGG